MLTTLGSPYTKGSGTIVLRSGTGKTFGSAPFSITVVKRRATDGRHILDKHSMAVFNVSTISTDTLTVSFSGVGVDQDFSVGDIVLYQSKTQSLMDANQPDKTPVYTTDRFDNPDFIRSLAYSKLTDVPSMGKANREFGFDSNAFGSNTLALGDNNFSQGHNTISGMNLFDCTISSKNVTILNLNLINYFYLGGPIGLISLSGGTGPLYTMGVLAEEPEFINGDTLLVLTDSIMHTSGKIFSTDYSLSNHVEGYNNIASGGSSHAEGNETLSLGLYSHSEGVSTKCLGVGSHSEGSETLSLGLYSHAEGVSSRTGYVPISCTISGPTLTVVGSDVTKDYKQGMSISFDFTNGKDQEQYSERRVVQTDSVLVDGNTIITVDSSVNAPVANIYLNDYGIAAHAEGSTTVALGFASHTEGYNSLASQPCQHSRASGCFSSPGDAQSSNIELFVNGTDGSNTELMTNGQNVKIPVNHIYAFIAKIAGRKSDGSSVAFFVRQGIASNLNGTGSLIGSIQTIGTDFTVTNWSITITCNNTGLHISATGAAHWVCGLEFVEIG